MEEEWRRVEDHPEYEVSNLGRMRVTKHGKIELCNIYVPRKNGKSSYPQVSIRVNGKSVTKNVHRFVAKAFIPLVEEKPLVNHKDGDKSNNKASNLEWADHSDNHKHAFQSGLRECPVRGENNPVGKLTEDQVLEIRKLKGKIPQYEIARMYGINQSNVSRIFSGEKWGWLDSAC